MCASQLTTAMLSYPNLRVVGPFTLTWWLLLATLQGISSTTIPSNQNSNSENQTTPSTSTYQTVNSGNQTPTPSDVATIPGNLAPSSSNKTATLTAVTTPPIVTSFINVVLRKCKCGKDQMFYDSQCIDGQTFIPTKGEGIFNLSTSYFREISVGVPNCKKGEVLVPLYNDVSRLYLIENGTLLWGAEEMFLENYCIEHIIYEDHVLSLQAFVCIPSPRVLQCCQPGYVLGSDGYCSPDNDPVTFAPSVFVEGSPVQWPEFVEETVDLTCSTVASMKMVSLNGKGALIYGTNQAEIVWRASNNIAETLHEQNYCVGMRRYDDSSEPEYVAKVCSVNLLLEHQTTCSNAICVRKCCKEGDLLSGQACMEAHDDNERWQPLFHDWRNHTLIGPPKEQWSTVFGMPFCDDFFTLKPKVADMDEFYLLTNGSLHIPLYSSSYLPVDYCIDLFLDIDHVSSIAVICAPKQKNECQWKFTMINVLRGISCFFLAATLGVYLGVPDLRDRTNGRCLVSMVVAMLTSNISLIIISEVSSLPNTTCIIAAFVGHVSTLAIFFWLNIMCFDMWSTLRSSKQQHHSLKVFSLYSVYAWGCPLLVGVVGLVLDLVKPKGVIRPNFTGGTCWFLGNAEFWLYLSGIIFILVVVNLLFFVHVAVTLVRKLKQRKMVFEGNNSHTNKSNKTKEQAWLYIKLFIVMGVVWITDVFSSLHDRNECKYWVVTDVINVLQGVFIFLVAVVNKDNLKKIRSSWKPRMDGVRQSVLTLRGNTSNKSRNVLSIDSEASRKTSVTSLPRKLSAVSNIIFSTGNKNRTTATIDENDWDSKSKEATQTRRASSESIKEVIPMEPLAE